MSPWKGRSYKSSHRIEAAADHRLTLSERRLLRWGNREELRNGSRGILLEGRKLIEEAVQVRHPLEAVWFTAEFIESASDIIRRVENLTSNLHQITAREMRGISGLETPPGVVAVAVEPKLEFRSAGDSFSLIVAVSMIQDPGNLGGVVRTCDFFGVDELWLGHGSADPFGPKAVRGGMGALFRLPMVRVKDLQVRIAEFKRSGAEVWAAVAHDRKAELEISHQGPRILMVGGESHGLSKLELALADRKVHIPGARRSESLNLAVAAGILIYNATSGRWSS